MIAVICDAPIICKMHESVALAQDEAEGCSAIVDFSRATAVGCEDGEEDVVVIGFCVVHTVGAAACAVESHVTIAGSESSNPLAEFSAIPLPNSLERAYAIHCVVEDNRFARGTTSAAAACGVDEIIATAWDLRDVARGSGSRVIVLGELHGFSAERDEGSARQATGA